MEARRVKPTTISSQVSTAEKALFLGRAAASGSDASGCGRCPPTADVGAFPSASNLDASGATVVEWRVQRLQGHVSRLWWHPD